MLTVASSSPEFFAIHGKGAVLEGVGFGCQCAKCDCEISAPFGYEAKLVWCLYCGMAEGYVVMVEIPCASHRWTFGVTREECHEDWAALRAGSFYEMCERRSHDLGYTISLY